MKLPALKLRTTNAEMIDLSALQGRTVVYAYPRTSPPNEGPIEGWDLIPGARGCTPQSCAFRDHFGELKAVGAQAVFGLSTQSTAFQAEAAERLHLPFALLSDEELELTKAMELPTFEAGGMVLLKRLTMIIKDGAMEHVMYPVSDPAQNAEDVIAYLKQS
uniref:peroxiredoxin n=1 Tax=unclassified Pseudovibrio TaxID=2627060 RepID=UPI0009EED05E|nr:MULTISPECIES: peroxiredoxin [unclassified Pseudovibrio]